MQPDLFSPKPVAVARKSDPVTSHEAAASVRDIRESQRVILDWLQRRGPMTDGELLFFVSNMMVNKMSPSGCRTRRKELVDMKFVRDSGRRQLTPSGRRTIVWEAVNNAQGEQT